MKATLVAFLIGLVAGVAGMAYVGSKQYGKLKTFADSIAKSDSVAKAEVHNFKDSMGTVVATLTAKKQKVIVKAIADTSGVAAAESALVVARTTADSMKDLKTANEALKAVNVNLWKALAFSDSISAVKQQVIDSLSHTVDGLNDSVQKLTQRINKLHGTPKWLSISFEVVKIGGAAYGGYELGKHH
jgi:prophage DNA circulation protein